MPALNSSKMGVVEWAGLDSPGNLHLLVALLQATWDLGEVLQA